MSRLLRSAPLLLVLAALPLSAQFYNAPANRVTKANGEPSGSLCAASGDVGKVYVVANSASTASPLRICTNTGIGTFAWESSGGGSGSVTPADIEAATWCLAASGSGTTYTCATTNSAALALGQIYNFGIDTTNSGNVTLNVNGQGAKAVLHKNSQQFAAGDLVASDSIYLYYDGTQFVPLAEQRSTNQGCIISGEAAANGNETITECAPASLASSWSIIKPSSAGTAGQVLTSGGAAGQQTWGTTKAYLLDWQKATTAITLDGTDKTIWTTTVPAAAITAGGCLKLSFIYTHSTGSDAVDYKLFYGASSITIYSHAAAGPWLWSNTTICNGAGVTNAQQFTSFPGVYLAATGQFGINGSSTTYTGTYGIDSSTQQTLKLTANASSSNAVTPVAWIVEVANQ